MILYKIQDFLVKIDCYFHKINVGRIIAYHTRGKVKTRIESWNNGNHIIYFEGKLYELRRLKRKFKKKIYKERIYCIQAKDDFLEIQLERENLKLEKLLKRELENGNNIK